MLGHCHCGFHAGWPLRKGVLKTDFGAFVGEGVCK
jgi:hypothetical protein